MWQPSAAVNRSSKCIRFVRIRGNLDQADIGHRMIVQVCDQHDCLGPGGCKPCTVSMLSRQSRQACSCSGKLTCSFMDCIMGTEPWW